MARATPESLLGAFSFTAIAAFPTVAALNDWERELTAWVAVGLAIVAGAFYAVTHW